jgi:TolA-binding protein
VLKLGLSLSALDKNKEACGAYDLLKKDFPKASQEIARRVEAERKRLRCS